MTASAAELLEQRGASGTIAIRLVPRWHPLAEKHVVDRSLVEQSTCAPTRIPRCDRIRSMA